MDEQNLPPCAYCGCKGYLVKGAARGRVASYFDERGKHIETSTDKMYFELSDTVRCEDCLKVNRALWYDYKTNTIRKIDPIWPKSGI